MNSLIDIFNDLNLQLKNNEYKQYRAKSNYRENILFIKDYKMSCCIDVESYDKNVIVFYSKLDKETLKEHFKNLNCWKMYNSLIDI